MPPAVASLVAESLDLRVDPSASGYSGTAALSFEGRRGAAYPPIHARGLSIDEVLVDGIPQPTRVDDEVVGIGVSSAGGRTHILIRFHTDFAESPSGLYRFRSEGEWYVVSDFEPADARSAWPCVDHPATKVPFTLRVSGYRPGDVVVSNMAPTSVGSTASFPATPPLPAYLVALAVGPWVGTPDPHARPPSTVWTVRGHEHLAPLVSDLSRTTFTKQAGHLPPVPWSKLDWVLLPDLTSGAMENPGAITLSERTLAGGWTEQTVAHELAHLWFGDWVTAASWEDLWLNESFADWFAGDVGEWGGSRAWLTARVLEADGLEHTQALRPSHDGWRFGEHRFLYQKGRLVLESTRDRMGKERFDQQLSEWFVRWGGQSASTEDWLDALPRAIRDEVGSMVTEAGSPLVTVTRLDPHLVSLKRSTWTAPGSASHPRSPAPTHVSVVLLEPEGKRTVEVDLGEEPRLLELAEGTPILAPATGLYAWDWGSELSTLLGALPTLEGSQSYPALARLDTLVDGLRLPLDELLGALTTPWFEVGDETSALLWLRLWNRLEVAHHAGDPALLAAAHARLGAAAAALRRTDSARSERVGAALDRVDRHLGADPPEVAWNVLRGATIHPTPAEWDSVDELASNGVPGVLALVQGRLRDEREPLARIRLLVVLARCREPLALDAALALALDPTTPRHEAWTVLDVLRSRTDESDRERVYTAVSAAWDTLAQRLDVAERQELLELVGGCDLQRIARGRAFFEGRIPGAAALLDLREDETRACGLRREADLAAVRRLLSEG